MSVSMQHVVTAKPSYPFIYTGRCHASNQLSAAVAPPAGICILNLDVRVWVQRLSNVLRSASMRTGVINTLEWDEAEVETQSQPVPQILSVNQCKILPRTKQTGY